LDDFTRREDEKNESAGDLEVARRVPSAAKMFAPRKRKMSATAPPVSVACRPMC
jgi:hypothetical protein